MFTIALTLLLSWGAFAFGAEYTWAYTPLLVFACITSLLGFRAARGGVSRRRPILIIVLVAPLLAAVMQLAPMPQQAVQRISPDGLTFDYQALYDKTTTTVISHAPRATLAWAPLSIAPQRTVLGVVFLGVLLLLLMGCTKGFGVVAPAKIARVVIVLGALAAFAQLIQRALGADAIYGFWLPPTQKGQYASAPFINRNHTAGWLLMAMALSAGYVAVLASRFTREVSGWRARLLRLSTPEASELMMASSALLLMAVAVVATASRSGFFAFALLVLVFMTFVLRYRRVTVKRKIVGITLLASMFVMALLYGGIEVIETRLSGTHWTTLDGRVQLWRDTVHIVNDSAIVGTGLNTYGIAMLRYQSIRDGFQYIEAHNDYLQLAAEGGLLLGIPVVVAALFLIFEVRSRFREGNDDLETYWLRVGAVTGILAISAQEAGEFTLQMPGAAVLFVVLVAIAVHRRPSMGAIDRTPA